MELWLIIDGVVTVIGQYPDEHACFEGMRWASVSMRVPLFFFECGWHI